MRLRNGKQSKTEYQSPICRRIGFKAVLSHFLFFHEFIFTVHRLPAIERSQRKAVFTLFIVLKNHRFGVAQSSGPPLFRCTDDCLDRYPAYMIFKYIISYGITICHNNAGDAHQDAARKRVVLSFPCCRCQTECPVQNSLSVFIIDAFQSGNRTDAVPCFGRGDAQTISPPHHIKPYYLPHSKS